jgi:D-glycero-alpha-D-manno-heptose-7-phosphate kinase
MSPTDDCVVARVPLRLPLGGGGTDLPFYATRYGADLVSVTITLSVTVVVRRGRLDGRTRFTRDRMVVGGSGGESPEPYLTAACRLAGVGEPLEVVSLGPVPAGTGLGSSGAFAVGLLAALGALRGRASDPAQLAEQAAVLEMDLLGRPVGKHDQYVCALGGVRRIIIEPDGRVRLPEVAVAAETLVALEARLLLLYTGQRRDSADHLRPPTARDAVRQTERLHRIKELGGRIRTRLETGDLDGFALLLHEHWMEKRAGDPGPWDDIYAAARSRGASAGKLVGAGGGGFLLLYVEPGRRADVLAVAAKHGLRNVEFGLNREGVRVTVVPGFAGAASG